MSLAVEGKIHKIFDSQQVTERFKKREFVLEIPNNWGGAEYPKFQLTQDRCAILDSYNEGDNVKVHFNLSGRPYNKDGNTLYFTNLNAWQIEVVGGAGSSDNAQGAVAEPNEFYNQSQQASTDGPTVDATNDDLPF